MHPALGVDNGAPVGFGTHPGGAGQMPLRGQMAVETSVKIGIGLHRSAGENLRSAEASKGRLVNEFTNNANPRPQQIAVTRVFQVICQNARR